MKKHLKNRGTEFYQARAQALVQDAFRRLMTACGWAIDENEVWTSPNGLRWPDHVPTILQAETLTPISGALVRGVDFDDDGQLLTKAE